MKYKISVEIVKVTPEMAAEWLQECFDGQRKVRNTQVARLISDMQAGRFRISPDAILRIKGKIANGQHRLWAVVNSGIAQEFIVMESSDSELYKIIDCGMRRTVGDALSKTGQSRIIPSIARWVIAYDNQTITRSVNYASAAAAVKTSAQVVSSSKSKINKFHISQAEMIDYCQSNGEVLCAAATFVRPLYEKTKLISESIGGAIHVLASSRGLNESGELFLTQLYTGADIHPACLLLRNRLISNRGSTAQMAQGYIFGLCLKAFKAFKDNKAINHLKWTEDEGFPLCFGE